MPRLAPEARFPSVRNLVLAALARRLDRGEIEAEIDRQIDRFEAAMGFPPHFVDGHHHVHQLPVIRDALLAVYERRLRSGGAWLRYCVEPLGRIMRRAIAPGHAAIIALLGRRLARLGRKAGVPGNTGFRGVRSFTADEDWPAMMASFLTDPTDGMVVMCHPAIPDKALEAADRVVEPRRAEYDYLQSAAFVTLCAEKGVALERLSDLFTGAARQDWSEPRRRPTRSDRA